MVERPKVVRPFDLATFTAAAAVLTALAIGAQIYPQETEAVRTVGRTIAWVAAVVAWAANAWYYSMRYRFVRSIAFVTRHGLLVRPEGFSVSRADVEAETERFVETWTAATGDEILPRRAISGVLVTFAPFPFQSHGTDGLVSGLAWPSKAAIAVGYPGDLERSAFAHELGHVVFDAMRRRGDVPSAMGYHQFASEHGLP